MLLGVDEADWRVAVVSRNAEELLGRPAAAVLGAPLAAVLGQGPADAVRQHVAVTELHVEGAGVPLRLARGVGRAAWVGQPVEAVMHRSGGLLVLEIEPDLRDPASAPLSHRATRAAITHLAATRTVLDLAQALASQIRNLTGHDRVMVYRFDPEWNGEVIAEDRREDLEPFLGLHYPASDIPVQARHLYGPAGPGSSPTCPTSPARWCPRDRRAPTSRSTCPWRCCAASPRSTWSTSPTWASRRRCRCP